MAFKNQESDDDLVQCSICTNQFQSYGTRVPKMLPCQHSFCIACLRSVFNGGRIQCPVCRREYETTAERLPESLLLMQLIDRRGPKQQPLDPDPVIELRKFYQDPAKAKTALVSLFREIEETTEYSRDTLDLVMQCMDYYRSIDNASPDVMVAATACIWRLIANGGSNVEIKILGQIAKDVTSVRNAFKDNTTIRKNAICVLRNSRMLDLAVFDYFEVTKIGLDSLETDGTEDGVLEILSWLPRRLNGQQNGSLGSRENIRKLLKILERKLTTRSHGQSLTWLLEALSSMTDETPPTCYSIVSENGLLLLTKLLRDKAINLSLKSSALITLSNISEVPGLREDIIKCESIDSLLQNLFKEDSPKVKFLAVDTVANISMVSKSVWIKLTGKANLREKLLNELYKNVMSWKFGADSVNTQFDSFNPMYPLLQRYDTPPIQLYGAWTICNFCASERKYQEMLIREQGIDILLELRDNAYADPNVRQLAKQTLESIH